MYEHYTRPSVDDIFAGKMSKYALAIAVAKRAREITNEKGFCIIPDLRFETELHSLRRACNDRGYKCIIINIGYPDIFERNANERGLHISEKQLKEFDYYISNKKEKFFVLFNEVLKFYQQSILK